MESVKVSQEPYQKFIAVGSTTQKSPIVAKTVGTAATGTLVLGQLNSSAASSVQRGRSRYDQRKSKRYQKIACDAVERAFKIDLPLNFFLTITWSSLFEAGQHNEGHCLWRGAKGRDEYIRTELNRLCRSAGLPFAAIWSRDSGKVLGLHFHILMFWPTRMLSRLIAVIERVTGSRPDFVTKPYSANDVAKSSCGGWLLRLNSRDKKGAGDLALYIANQQSKHPVAEVSGKVFGVSQTIGPAAERHLLEPNDGEVSKQPRSDKS